MFTIITAIIALCILSLLFFDFGKKYLYFIIAFQVGVFAIVTYCIYRIIRAELRLQKGADRYVVRFDECPDYYTKRVINGEEHCFNDYIVKDQQGKVYVIRLTPQKVGETSITPPKTIIVTDKATPQDPLYAKFKLHALENDAAIKTYEDKCTLLFTPPPNESKYIPHSHYTYIPWTYAKSRCQSLAQM